MVDLTQLKSFKTVYPIMIEKYETFIPNIEEQDIIGKFNSIIEYLNKIGKLSNQVVKEWNLVMKWIIEEGLNESVKVKIDEMLVSDEFNQLVQDALNDMNVATNQRLDGVDTSLNQVKTELASISSKSKFSQNTICLTGDSLTALNSVKNTGVSESVLSEGYFSWANVFLNQRFTVLNNGAISGYRSDQVLAELDAKVIAYKPNYCFFMVGTNDILQAIDYNVTIANIRQIYDKLKQNNIQIITAKVLPSGGFTTATQITAYNKINDFIQKVARTENGILLVDLAKYFIDATTGNPLAGYTYDGVTHQNTKGGFYMGKALFEALQHRVPEVPLFCASNKFSTALNTNPMMLDDNSGVATGYNFTNQLNTTPSKVARTDGISGVKQRLTVSAVGASDTYFKPISSSLVNAGDTVCAQVEVEVSSLVSYKQMMLYLNAANSSNANVYISQVMYQTQGGTHTLEGFKGVLRTPPFVVPPTGIKVLAGLQYNLQGVIDISRFEIIKL